MSMLQANQRHVPPGARRRTGERRAAWIALVLIALILVACAGEEDGRQFANDPRTPRPTATSGPIPTMPAGMPPPARPNASPEALVDRRGAPDAAWWLDNGSVWLVGDGAPQEVISGGALAIAPGPGSHEVAVATMAGSSYRIDTYDRDGHRIDRFEDVLPAAPAVASPVALASPVPDGDGLSPDVTLDWSPQGNHILLGHRSGALVDIRLDGEVTPIEARVPLSGLEQAAWSPRGDVIAVLVRDADGIGSLALVDPATDPARVSVIGPVGRANDRAKSIEAFDWKPRGDGIVYIEAQRDEARSLDGVIVGWDRATNSMQILATGGQGGPSGSVTWLSVAPDGKAVAYVVTMQGGGGSAFVGLFVRSLIDGQLYRVPVEADASVIRAWWLRDGVAWVSAAGDSERRFVFIDGQGERSLLGTLVPGASGTPASSPAPSPVFASPAASPVASPLATTATVSPAAIPAATPTN